MLNTNASAVTNSKKFYKIFWKVLAILAKRQLLFLESFFLFLFLGAHAKFENPSCLPSGRKGLGRRKKIEEKIKTFKYLVKVFL